MKVAILDFLIKSSDLFLLYGKDNQSDTQNNTPLVPFLDPAPFSLPVTFTHLQKGGNIFTLTFRTPIPKCSTFTLRTRTPTLKSTRSCYVSAPKYWCGIGQEYGIRLRTPDYGHDADVKCPYPNSVAHKIPPARGTSTESHEHRNPGLLISNLSSKVIGNRVDLGIYKR